MVLYFFEEEVMLGNVYGYARCPECGLSVPEIQLQHGSHVCDPERIIEYQVQKANKELENLESDIAEYLTTERAQKLLAFHRWNEEEQRKKNSSQDKREEEKT